MRATPGSLGRVGVWSRELRFAPDRGAASETAAELEELGYGALFIPDVGGDVFGTIDELLAATIAIPIVTGILNIWMHGANAVAAQSGAVVRRDRFLCGLGASHQSVIDDRAPGRYERPLSTMRAYLDELDCAPVALGADERILAALGPRMLDLARDRAAGAHPYLVPVAHTAQARERLGPGRLLCPEVPVALAADPVAAREMARAHVTDYLALPNYVNNLRRLGFEDPDFSGGPSDRLVDALVAYGDEEHIAARVAEHLDAGANHVCVQVVGQVDEALAVDQWRRLAPALTAL